MALESTVVNVCNSNQKILRLGSITHEQIKKIIPNIIIDNKNSENLSPGRLNKHYSPNKPIRINIHSVIKGEVFIKFWI